MIDLEKEHEAFNAEFKNIGREYSINLNSVGFSGTLSANELGWLACAESKQAEIDSLKAQLANVKSGEFVVVPKDQLYQWGHMANYAQEYGCPECFEARGYAHNLACEINEYLKPVNAAQENSHE